MEETYPSDAGLLLVKEFASKLGFVKLLKSEFKTQDPAFFRQHKDDENLWQVIYSVHTLKMTVQMNLQKTQCLQLYFKRLLLFHSLPCQGSLTRMDESTLNQFYYLMRRFREIVYSIKKPNMLLLDLDSTLLDTYGNQEGSDFNYHYRSRGYHPLVCFDGITEDILKVELRDGTDYSSTGVMDFLQPLLDEFNEDYPDVS